MYDDHASTKAKQYFTTIKLLKTFQKHYGAAPRDLEEMRAHWTRAFRGLESAAAGSRRFSQDTEQALNRNWDRLEAHVAKLQMGLKRLGAEIEAEAREAWRDVSVRMAWFCP